MNKGRARELQQLFHEAMELPEAERVAFLAEASGSDPELSSVVEDLIRASSSAAGFLADENREKCVRSFPPSDRQPPEGAGSASAPQEGEVVGDYEILEKIGGNMGLVFKARHRLLDKVVALKVLPADWTADSACLARFQRELRIMGQLQHPNLVAASDARVEGRWHLVAMELIEGLDLDRLMEARGPLPVAAACEAARQAALGLEHAHQRGLIHRDIKPSNLMLTPTGTIKVIDLGLALIKGEPDARLTKAGVVMGTVSYCAPEQFRDASRVDIRADIYSLGCTLFHLLTGERPYGEMTSLAEVMQAHLNEPFPALHEARPDAPPGLAKVLARMTAKDPAGRFASPAEAADALRPFAEGADLQSLFSQAGQRTLPRAAGSRGSRSKKRAPILAAAAAIAAALGLVWAIPRLGPRPGSSPSGALQVTSLQVEHISNRSGKAVPRGRIGTQSFKAEPGDDVQVSLTLSEPGYFYLLALNPDGEVQLCWPQDEERPPEKSGSVRFPMGGAQGFGLTDGEGLQGFLVAASREPLPAYARWRAEQAGLPWGRTQAEGVWRFDGAKLEPESDQDSRTRGEVRSLRGLEPFSKVCETLSARPELHSVRAIAFPVERRK